MLRFLCSSKSFRFPFPHSNPRSPTQSLFPTPYRSVALTLCLSAGLSLILPQLYKSVLSKKKCLFFPILSPYNPPFITLPLCNFLSFYSLFSSVILRIYSLTLAVASASLYRKMTSCSSALNFIL